MSGEKGSMAGAVISGGSQIAGGIVGGAVSSKASRKQRELAERLANQEREDYQKQFAWEQEQARIENERKSRELALQQASVQMQQSNAERGLGMDAMASLARGRAEAFGNSQQNRIRDVQYKAMMG
jgi:hypothetical protein